MRLAFISSSFPPYTSGVAVNAATITSGLAEKGHEVGLFIPEYPPEKTLASSLVSSKLHLLHLPSIQNPLKKTHRYIVPNHKILLARLESFNPEVIHLQEPNFFLFKTLKKFSAGLHTPLVCAHHFPPQFITNQIPSFLPRKLINYLIVSSVVRLYNQTDMVITPTHTMDKMLKNHGLKVPVSVISNGVDTHKYTLLGSAGRIKNSRAIMPPETAVIAGEGVREHELLSAELPVILYLGRIDFDKNLDTLINAAKFIKTPCEIWFAGSGKAVSYLTSLSLSLPQIKFLGYIPEDKKAGIFRQASIFVIPSTAEAQSIVSLEAAACGVPLILANAAALPELIDKKHPNGVLFDPNNPGDLAAKIDYLLPNTKKLAEMGHNSRLLAEKHDITKIISQYEKTYLSLL